MMMGSRTGKNEFEFKGSLKYNSGIDVNWGDAIVYSDLISDESSNEVEKIGDNTVNVYKQELQRELKVNTYSQFFFYKYYTLG